MAQAQRKKVAPAPLPDKLYYSISEVAKHSGVKPHVLRYWEQEFPTLRPKKNRAGNRSYRSKDIEEILRIRDLLYEKGFKIEGARKLLKERDATAAPPLLQLDLVDVLGRDQKVAELRAIRADLQKLAAWLKKDS